MSKNINIDTTAIINKEIVSNITLIFLETIFTPNSYYENYVYKVNIRFNI